MGYGTRELIRRLLTEDLYAEWRDLPSEQYAREAALYQDQWPSDHPAGQPVEVWEWHFLDRYPIGRLLGNWQATDWIRWYEAEKNAAEADGRPNQYAYMEDQPIHDPVVIVEPVGGDFPAFLWDGNHRIGASLSSARLTIPAIVGTPKEIAP